MATSWVDDYVPSTGAALASYAVFSLAPLLLIVITCVYAGTFGSRRSAPVQRTVSGDLPP